MQRSLSNSAHQLVAVGAIAFVGFPLFYVIWAFWLPQPYENLPLRLIGSLLGLGLMLTPYWPLKWKQYLSWYWFLTLLFTLPYFLLFIFNESSKRYFCDVFVVWCIFTCIAR